jgi:hypothetical protein
LDDRGLKRARPGEGTKDGWDLLAKLQTFNWQESPWKEKYPQLVNIMQDEPKLPLHNVFSGNIAINCQRFLQMHGTVKTTTLPRLDFHDNLAFGQVNTADATTFPQTEAGKKRVEFRSETLLDTASLDLNNLKIQESNDFKRLAPWFKRIPIEKIGLPK